MTQYRNRENARKRIFGNSEWGVTRTDLGPSPNFGFDKDPGDLFKISKISSQCFSKNTPASCVNVGWGMLNIRLWPPRLLALNGDVEAIVFLVTKYLPDLGSNEVQRDLEFITGGRFSGKNPRSINPRAFGLMISKRRPQLR